MMDQLLSLHPPIQSIGNFSGIRPKQMAIQPNCAATSVRRQDSVRFGNATGPSPAAQLILRSKADRDAVKGIQDRYWAIRPAVNAEDSLARFFDATPGLIRASNLWDSYRALPQKVQRDWRLNAIAVLERISQGDQSVTDKATEHIIPWLFDTEFIELDGNAVKITKLGELLLSATRDPDILKKKLNQRMINDAIIRSSDGALPKIISGSFGVCFTAMGIIPTPASPILLPLGLALIGLPIVMIPLKFIGYWMLEHGKLSGMRLVLPFGWHLTRKPDYYRTLTSLLQQAKTAQKSQGAK